MGTGRMEDEMLQRYHDGELPPEEVERVRAVLQESADDAARLERLERLGDLIRLSADDVASDLSSDELFAAVKRGIVEEEQRRPGTRLRMVEGGKQSRQRTAVVAVLALAAAGLLVYLWPRDTGTSVAGTQEQRPVEETPQMPVVVDEPPAGSEVVEVDFGENTGTVFAVEGDAGEPIAVVWIDEESP